MKSIKFLLNFSALLFIFSIAAFAQTGTISGRVTYMGGTPLHSASVRIVQLNRTAVTNEEGLYQFTNVPRGRYTILVHLEGFADATRVVDLTADGAQTVNFQLNLISLQEQVTVTAGGTEQTVFDAFQSVNSVGSTRIVEQASTSIGEVLEFETGVAKRSFGPGSARPVIRGFDGDRVLILQNGVRTGSVGSQSADHGEPIDPLTAERIEVVKGPATLLYGSNAIGGVVNVIANDENRAHDGLRGFVTGIGGTVNRQAALSAGLEYGWNNFLFRGNSSVQRTGDYETPVGRIPNSSARSTTQSFGLGYYGEKAYLNGNYGFDLRRYGIPFAALFHEHHEEEEDDEHLDPFDLDEEVDIRQRQHNFRFNGGFRNLNNSFLSGIQYNLDY
ncbi:MAG TPA: TonB-dependent receptor, partial [Pyrinomonadaceae bacterium]|nr:TonB-dependent receptor [Pyrinomonadaceae bacterium]